MAGHVAIASTLIEVQSTIQECNPRLEFTENVLGAKVNLGNPNISPREVIVVPQQCVLGWKKGFPKYEECKRHEHEVAVSLIGTPGARILFFSYRWQDTHNNQTDSVDNIQHAVLKQCLESPDGHGITHVWVDLSCSYQDIGTTDQPSQRPQEVPGETGYHWHCHILLRSGAGGSAATGGGNHGGVLLLRPRKVHWLWVAPFLVCDGAADALRHCAWAGVRNGGRSPLCAFGQWPGPRRGAHSTLESLRRIRKRRMIISPRRGASRWWRSLACQRRRRAPTTLHLQARWVQPLPCCFCGYFKQPAPIGRRPMT